MTPTVAITRSVDAVADETFDVVVAGAGIYGVLSAVESAHRGLRTLLVERADFGAGASFNSLRTIHGGLRYLQRLDFARARTSARQRDWWLRNFPELIQPVCCLMPLYGRGLRRPAAFRAAFAMTRLLGLNGAQDLPGEHRLQAPRLLGPDQVRKLVPAISIAGLKAGALWWDAFMTDSCRVLIEAIRWAIAGGARVLNYAELTDAMVETGGRSRLSIQDRVSGRDFTVTTRTIINATGSNVDEVAQRLGYRGKPLLLPTMAWNLLLDVRPPSVCSLAVTPPYRGAPTYFVHPFHGRVLVGTGHSAGSFAGARQVPSADMVRAMQSSLEAALPGAGLGQCSVLRVLAGTLPGVHHDSSKLATRPLVARYSAAGGAALWSVVGVKFTEAPDVARKVLDAVTRRSRDELPRRPIAADKWDVLHDAEALSRTALLQLAANESAICFDDLLERRTNGWCDEDMRKRIKALVGDDFNKVAA